MGKFAFCRNFIVFIVLPMVLMSAIFASIKKPRKNVPHLPSRSSLHRHFMNKSIFIPTGLWSDDENSTAVDNAGVTVVTAFVDIGDHEKGSGGHRKVSEYMKWMNVWEQILNPVICFTDSSAFKGNFLSKRAKFNAETKVIKVKREDYWSFSLVPMIRDIFAKPGYPRHPPNTVLPEYAAVMSAKYDFLEKSIQKNYYRTKYYMWLDLGLFRGYPNTAPCFFLVPPPQFQENSIAVNSMSTMQKNMTAEKIIRTNAVAVGGGVIFGTGSLLLDYVKQYRRAVWNLLNKGLMGADQQVIYSAYADASLGIKNPIPLKQYSSDGKKQTYNTDPWFYLAYLMRNESQCPT